jgi:hypothetical protein
VLQEDNRGAPLRTIGSDSEQAQDVSVLGDHLMLRVDKASSLHHLLKSIVEIGVNFPQRLEV